MAANRRDLVFALKFATANEAAIKKAAAGIRAAATAAGKASTQSNKAGLSFKKLGLAAASAGRRMAVMGRQMRSAFTRMRTSVIRLQTAIFSLGIGFGFVKAIQVAKEYEFQLARLSAITGNIGNETGAQFTALEQTARRLGATTEFTAGQVANGLRLLAQAGFSANEAVAAIPGTLNLAIAATTDLGTATTITANTIRGFKLDAREAGDVADILTAVTQKSNTTITLLGEALKFVAPAAQSAGQSLKTAAAALGALSNAGLKGTLAGTGLRRVLVGLLNPTAAAKKAFESLGLSIEEIRPEADNLIPTLAKLREHGFGAVEAFEAFGLRGGPAALVLTTLFEDVERLTVALDESSGIAQAFADRINNTLRGALLRMKSAFEELIISQGALAEGFRNIVDNIRGVLEALNGTLDLTNESAESYLRAAETLRNLGASIKWVTELFLTLLPVMIIIVPLFLVMAGNVGLAAAALIGLSTTWIATMVGASGAELAIQQMNDTLEDTGKLSNDMARFAARLQDIKDKGGIIDSKDLEDFGALAGIAKNIKLGILVTQLAAVNTTIAETATELERLENIDLVFDVFNDMNIRDAEQKLAKNDELRKSTQDMIASILSGVDAYDVLADANRKANDVFMDAVQDATTIASRFAGIIGGAVTKAHSAIVDLDKKATVLRKTFEEGEIAGALESSLQEAGLSDIDFRELDRLFADLEKKKVGVATKLAEAVASGDVKMREMAIKAQDLLERERITLEERRAELEAQVPALKDALLWEKFWQDLLTEQTEDIDANKAAIDKRNNALKSFNRFRINQLAKIQEEIILERTLTEEKVKAEAAIKLINRAVSLGLPVTQAYIDSLFKMLDALEEVQEESNTFFTGFGEAMREYIDEAEDFAQQGADVFNKVFGTLEDELLRFVETGEFSFKKLGATIVREIAKIGIKSILSKGLGAVEKLFPGSGGLTGQEAANEHLKSIEAALTQELQTGAHAYLQKDDIQPIKDTLKTIQTSLKNLENSGGVGGGGGGAAASGALGGGAQTTSTGGSLVDAAGGILGLLQQGAGIYGQLTAKRGIANTSIAGRSGAIPAILHSNEAVIPLTKNKRIPVGVRGGKFVAMLPGGRGVPIDMNAPSFAEGFGGFGGSQTTLGDEFGSHQSFLAANIPGRLNVATGAVNQNSIVSNTGSGLSTAGGLLSMGAAGAAAAGSTLATVAGAAGSAFAAFGTGMAIGQFLYQLVAYFRDREKDSAKSTGRIVGFGKTNASKQMDPLFDLISLGRSAVKSGAYAKGGVIDRPTLSLIGEAGVPEAVVPLPDGRSIPVKATGMGDKGATIVNVTYNIATPNADSFRGAQSQIMATTAANLERAVRRSV